MTPLPRLWLCADLELSWTDELAARVGAALQAGPAVVWLRAPAGASARTVLYGAAALRRVASRHGGLLLVGDHVDVALAVDADGVHLTERSLLPADARRFARRPLVVSRAVHDAAGAARAEGADAVVISPFGEVPGKGPALGPAGFAALRALAPATFAVALGGVTDGATARAARAAGADAVAVRRALYSVDPAARCAELLAALS
jgi:thiamine-phosphate pyrophosphorylase